MGISQSAERKTGYNFSGPDDFMRSTTNGDKRVPRDSGKGAHSLCIPRGERGREVRE